MGVDGTLFARRARRAIYLDRLYHWLPDDLDGMALHDKLRGEYKGDGKATADDVIKLCGILMSEEAASTDAERNKKTWLWELCAHFAAEHPDDEFFIQSDHDGPAWWDIKRDGGYLVWDPYDTKKAPWDPDYVAPPPAPPPPPLTPEQRRGLEELAHALSVPSTDMVGGYALKLESLEPVLTSVTYHWPHHRVSWLETWYCFKRALREEDWRRWWQWLRNPGSLWFHLRWAPDPWKLTKPENKEPASAS